VTEADGVTAETHDLRLEWFHEAVTMALYIGLSLLAVLVAQPPQAQNSESHLWLTILITSVALLLAHQVAFRLSSRLVNKGLLDPGALRLLAAQSAGGLFAGLLAALPVLLFGSAGVLISEGLILALVAATGYRAARLVPTSRWRALLYVGALVVVVAVVLAVKSLAAH
jgi:hypothetical protein